MYDASKANEVTDGINAGVEARQQRGMEIAAVARIEKRDGFFYVPSQTNPRQGKYKVCFGPGRHPSCNCPDYEIRACRCKHIYAVQYYLRRERNDDGSETVTETVTVTSQRKTYPQNWSAYNQAQTNEKAQFQILLHDLCKGIDELPTNEARRGRPRLPLADAIFASVFKVYSTMSARRFASDLCDAQGKGYISRVPHFNSVLNYLEMPEMFPILTSLIERASAPLQSVESKFAVDSTGFTSCRFVRWFDVKYNRFTSEQQWVKAHICCGVNTNVVTAIEIGTRNQSDDHTLPALVDTTAKTFTMKEVSADKGYSGRNCHDAIAKVGAVPFIAFRAKTTGKVGGLFEKMWHYFSLNREDFLAHYHQRSNVESTVMMIKSKFGDAVRSKTEVAAKNEVLAKVLCHNICCLISAMFELGIQPNFGLAN